MVRAAFVWNLVVELARLGASASLVAPPSDEGVPLWPDPGRGPLGTRVSLAGAGGLAALDRAACDVASARAAHSPDDGLVVVAVPPAWLGQLGPGRPLLRRVLLFSSPQSADLMESYALAKQVLLPDPAARVGVAIHGASSIDEARGAFEHLAGVAHRHLGRPLESYGLLLDDLHVYRAIVSRRPIGLEHPQSRAARALRDVARMLLEDARTAAVV